jgi:hypothetical protein
MMVVGAFTDTADEDAFVWIRKFRDAEEREEQRLSPVHGWYGVLAP